MREPAEERGLEVLGSERWRPADEQVAELVLEPCHGDLQRSIGARARRAREAGDRGEVPLDILTRNPQPPRRRGSRLRPRQRVLRRIPAAPVPLGGIGVAVARADLVL